MRPTLRPTLRPTVELSEAPSTLYPTYSPSSAPIPLYSPTISPTAKDRSSGVAAGLIIGNIRHFTFTLRVPYQIKMLWVRNLAYYEHRVTSVGVREGRQGPGNCGCEEVQQRIQRTGRGARGE